MTVTPFDLVVIGGGPAGEKGAAQAAYCIQAVFNYPTLGEAYKYAAYDGLQNLARAQAGPPAPETP